MKKSNFVLLVPLLVVSAYQPSVAGSTDASARVLDVEVYERESGRNEFRYRFDPAKITGEIRLVLNNVCLSDKPDDENKLEPASADGILRGGRGFMMTPPKIMQFRKLELTPDPGSDPAISIHSVYQPGLVVYRLEARRGDDGAFVRVEKGITAGPACKFIDSEEKAPPGMKSRPDGAPL